ncbi:hypothetical protein KUTeg_010251 [Tegillarca granosa]|uniref:Uncharacterized protein n=1 Tax=Tegillarca granosa TaxID=220873 RepID=A0ABQ9F675_TEGGR|nr:hypothetical protein KUTeg_010251 [Tegillarca granosa]
MKLALEERDHWSAFLIPFFLMLILCGVPLLYMELAVGQYTRQGPIGALAKICPLFKGAGLATVVISFLFTTYYNVIITWAFYYLFNTFTSVLPWSSCNNYWNSPNCFDGSNYSTVLQNVTMDNITQLRNVTGYFQHNETISPTEDFFESKMLQKSTGIEDQGVVYFTATFPYVVLITLLVRGLTLDGSYEGVKYFIFPKWELLLDAKVWVNAAAQNFNSLGIAFGGIITIKSLNAWNIMLKLNAFAISPYLYQHLKSFIHQCFNLPLIHNICCLEKRNEEIETRNKVKIFICLFNILKSKHNSCFISKLCLNN